MKKLIWFILIASFSAQANFIKEDDLNKCDGITIYSKKKDCERKEASQCFKVTKKYDCETAILVDEEVEDKERPVYSKTIVNECGEYCQTLFDGQYKDYKCEDSEESLILNLEEKQIYCTKLLRYKKKKTGRKVVAEDDSKKEAKQQKKEAEKAERLAEAEERKKIKELIGDVNSSELPNWHKKILRAVLKDMRD